MGPEQQMEADKKHWQTQKVQRVWRVLVSQSQWINYEDSLSSSRLYTFSKRGIFLEGHCRGRSPCII